MLRRIGVLYQNGALWSGLTLAENVALPLDEFTALDASTIADVVSLKLVKHGALKIYEGCPHGMCTTHADVINPDLLAFIQS